MAYNFKEIEKKWNKYWEDNPINKKDDTKEKYYCLDMFPYPSGAGLHVGHWRGYVISDAWARYQLLKGKYVIHPMGFDAFGLPAENYALKMHVHPSISTDENIKNFERQLKQISAIYDWDMELKTTDPDYYRWTQWIFVKLFEKGLAYEKEFPINWCPSCKTGLSNEDVVDGCCERCGTPVTKKNLRQWMLKITDYAERLLNDLDKLDWPEKVKKMQTEWIGKSYGAEVDFEIADEVASKTVGASKAVGASKTVGASTASPNIVEANKTVVASESVGASTASPSKNKITVYTTRPDTLYGATFMVLAPEHDLAMKLATDDKRAEVENYIKTASMKTNVDRMQVSDKDKTGVWTGRYAINPLNGKKIPIWISDYVLNDYGTGAIMCVPAHDTRDFAFAKKFNLDIVPVIAPKDDIHKFDNGMDEAFVSTDGIVINSGEWDGRVSSELKKNAPDELEKKGIGKKTVNYKIRDWVFSRQRYWGEPIPIVHCPKCGNVAVPVEELPLKLPDVKSYEPSGTGESPLVNITDWVNCKCPKCGGDAKRETNTMPQWAGSSWYFLRYIDVHNDKALVDKEKADKYLPVDMYIGGVEHAVLHLLYSRFWTKFLYDIGAIGFDEPFHKLFNQGMILGPKGVKMSKSLGNVVNPDEMVDNYGCDTLRMYELFIGPPDMDAAWDDRGIEGVYKYLNRLYNLVEKNVNENREATKECLYIRHNLIKAVTDRLEKFSLNTVISGFMEYTNSLIELDRKEGYIDKETLKTIAVLLSPFAPHVAEEFYHMLGGNGTVFEAGWPKFDENLAKADTVKLPIQVNGKTRGFVEVDAGADEKEVINKAKETIKEKLTGDIVKEIYVKGKIINFVVK